MRERRLSTNPLFRILQLGLIAALLVAPAVGIKAAKADEKANACLRIKPVAERLLCLADVAKKSGTAKPCHQARHQGVRWQCVAILAEHLGDAALCRTIPRTDQEYQGLYDVCLSDVAKVRKEPALCAEIATAGLRDSCFLKLVRDGAPKALCARINDRGLKSLCTGEPVYVH